MKSVLAVLLLMPLASWSRAQDPSPAALELAAKVRSLIEQMNQLADGDDGERKRLGEDLEAVIKRMQDRRETLPLDHYIEVANVLLKRRLADCVRVVNAGIQRYPDARRLYDYLGFACLIDGVEQRTPAGRKEKLAAGEAAFRKALTLKPETLHALGGLFQALSELDRPAEAIAQLDKLLPDEAKTAFTLLHNRRGALLMRVGRFKEAITELEGGLARAEDKLGSRILALRARALASGPFDAKKTTELVGALLKDDASPAATAAAADVLFYLGHGDDAAKLLDQRPVTAGKDETDDEVARRKQSHAALAVMVRSKELTGEPLRLALTQALDHHFTVPSGQKDAAGKAAPTDCSSSPVCMSLLLRDVRGEPLKTWANQILLALCLKDLAGYKPPADELAITDTLRKSEAGRFPDAPAYLPMVLAAMRRGVADPTQAGALIALRVADRLDDGKGRPTKK